LDLPVNERAPADDAATPAPATGPGGLIGLLSRFGIAGLINTAVGLAIIVALDLGLGMRPQLANAAGYAVAIAVSFLLSRNFVFRSRRPGAAWRFAIAIAVAFVANQIALTIAGAVLGAHPLARSAAQLCGMGVYTVTQFLVCYFWVFPPDRELAGASSTTTGK
jgi:putative flippase GtrA